MPSYQRKKSTEESSAVEDIRNSDVLKSNVWASHLVGQSNSDRLAMMHEVQHVQYGQHRQDGHETERERSEPQNPLKEYLPLERGAQGSGVILLQVKLNSFGADLVADGDYGRKTAKAIDVFQVANGLNRTGSVDQQTATTLYSSQAKNLDQAKLEGVPGQFLGEYDAYRGGEHIGSIDVVELDGKKVARKTAQAWKILKKSAADDGVHLQLNSGFRTMSEQRHLYSKYGSPRAAQPGYSNHQHGQALDIDASNPTHKSWLFNNAPSYGWRNTVSFEPWHWEYFGN